MTDFSIADHFAPIEDHRRDQGKLHRLSDILTIAICAVVAGAEGWEDIAAFGQAKQAWFEERLTLKHGTPSADTIRRVIARIDPAEFERCFLSWVGRLTKKIDGEVIAIDGKTFRGCYDKDDPKATLHTVSAWANTQGLVLAQRKVDSKSNEITAIPALLEVLDVAGCIVTLDAMGTQVTIAEQIQAQQADYVLALKANQGGLYEEVQGYFKDGARRAFAGMPVSQAETLDLGHGRKEIRRVWASSDVSWLGEATRWPGLKSIVEVESERHATGAPTLERRYFISSLEADAVPLLDVIRSHWMIENGVHWVLDVVFGEDASRIRREHGAENFGSLRRLALNLLRQHPSKKHSLRMKRKRAGWDNAFLAEVIGI